MKQEYHQLEPKRIAKRTLDKAEFREDVRGEKYEEGKLYRSRNYPGEYFTWHPYDKSEHKDRGAKGEWRMGAISNSEDDEE